MKTLHTAVVAALAALTIGQTAQATVIQSATSTLAGPAITFEGYAEGTIITNQYAGVTFSQVDGGTPQIDNSPFLFGYDAASGTGVLTGTTNGGAQFPTVAGLVLTLVGPGSGIEFWLGDTAPLGTYTIKAYDSSNTLIESFNVTPGGFVGFTGLTDLKWVSVNSSVENDAFAIDDVKVEAVPEPLSLGLVGLGLAALGMSRRKRAA
ncbi:MAG: PEP-CTERM sorting domain-containing protein [Rhodocyclaceae bacterium]